MKRGPPSANARWRTKAAAILMLAALPTMTNKTDTKNRPQSAPSTLAAWVLLAIIFASVQFASLFTPPLLDDADASHAQAAQHMAESGDWVTLKVDGIRYLEKPPLPYWLEAGFYRRMPLPPTCPMRWPCWAARVWRGCGQSAHGGGEPRFMPRWGCSPPSGRFCSRASPFRRCCSRFCCCWRFTALSPGWRAAGRFGFTACGRRWRWLR